MHFDIPSEKNQKELEAVCADQRLRGGRIIEYRRVLSAVVLTIQQPKFVRLDLNDSRFVAGLPSIAITAVGGWWSVSGVFATLSALLFNFAGGVDVTAVLAKSSPSEEDIKSVERQYKTRQIMFGVSLFLIFAVLFYVFLGESMAEAYEYWKSGGR